MATNNKQQLSGNNLMIVMILISLLVVGVSVLVGKALIISIVRDNKVVSAKHKADDQLKSDLDAAPRLVDAYNALGATANILNDALPTTSDLPSLIVTLENMGNSTGIQIKSVSPPAATVAAPSSASTTAPKSASAGTSASASPTSVATSTSASSSIPTTSPQTYNVNIDYDGSFAALQKFLADVETSARPMRVTSIQMAGTGNSMSGEIGLQTFYQDKSELPFGTEMIK